MAGQCAHPMLPLLCMQGLKSPARFSLCSDNDKRTVPSFFVGPNWTRAKKHDEGGGWVGGGWGG